MKRNPCMWLAPAGEECTPNATPVTGMQCRRISVFSLYENMSDYNLIRYKIEIVYVFIIVLFIDICLMTDAWADGLTCTIEQVSLTCPESLFSYV